MPSSGGHGYGGSGSANQTKAQLASAYNELGKELSSQKVRVVGNYTLGKVIGEGTYGKVRLGTHRLSATRVAIKQIPKALSAQLTREIHHHRRLHHPHVTQLYEVIATESYIWLVTELCAGGELFDYLVEKGRLTEDETRAIFGQLCLAVAYVHEQGVVHRDLKLENVLLDERCRVKLGDFGFTREYERGSLLDTYCGTTGYAAPEMLQCKKYTGQEVDVWSLGVIFYALLTGSLPFDDDDEDVMRDKIIKGEYEDPDFLTQDARDLIRGILVQTPSKRLTIAQIFSHKWFTDPVQPPPMPPRRTSYSSRPSRPASWSSAAGLVPSTPVQMQPTLEPTPEAPSIGSGSAFSHASSTFAGPSVSDMFDAHPESTPTTPEDSLHSHVHALSMSMTAAIDGLPRTASEATLAGPQARTNVTSGTMFGAVAEEDMNEDEARRSTQEERDQALAQLTSPGNGGVPSRPSPTPPLPIYPTRTPVRTKRRSVSSTLSQDADNPPPSGTSVAPAPRVDFTALLAARSPILFSSPPERELLNALAALGMDTGQMVHSVLSDACDAASAVWWMLRRKDEERRVRELAEAEERAKERAREEKERRLRGPSASLPELALVPATPLASSFEPEPAQISSPTQRRPQPIDTAKAEARASLVAVVAASRQPESHSHTLLPPLDISSASGFNTPPLASAGPKTPSPNSTPTPGGRPTTKPRSSSVSMLQRVGAGFGGLAAAAGVVRKKSEEKVKVDPNAVAGTPLVHSASTRSIPATLGAGLVHSASTRSVPGNTLSPTSSTVRERERVLSSPSEFAGMPVTPGGSGFNTPDLPRRGTVDEPKTPNRKLTKSPPVSKRDRDAQTPGTTIPFSNAPFGIGSNDSSSSIQYGSLLVGSPTVSLVGHGATGSVLSHESGPVAALRAADPMGSSRSTASSSKDSHGGSQSTHGHSSTGTAKGKEKHREASDSTMPESTGSGRSSRASILGAFTRWFQTAAGDERKGKKRKPPPMPVSPLALTHPYAPVYGARSPDRERTVRGPGRKKGRKRASVGSHRSGRSSSVNSRRSSTSRVDLTLSAGALGYSGLGLVRSHSHGDHLDAPMQTPDSLASFHTHRPPMHSKSPSSSSVGSVGRHHQHHHPSGMSHAQLAALRKTGSASPLQRYHARVGSGGSSSTTRVVRASKSSYPSANSAFHRGHVRSGSAASSSAASSRRGSWMHERERAPGDIFGLGGPLEESPSQVVSDAEYETPRRGHQLASFAQRRSGLYGTPSHSSVGRNSWKKSWGREPPGWSSRGPAQSSGYANSGGVTVEVLALDYRGAQTSASVRDVFSGKAAAAAADMGAGDDSDWVDEDDDVVDAFARGFGQVGPGRAAAVTAASIGAFKRGAGGGAAVEAAMPVTRGRNVSPSSGAQSGSSSTTTAAKGRQSPTMSSMALPRPSGTSSAADNLKTESVPDRGTTRRGQLATSSFKDPIAEADEDEEEE